MNKGSSRSHCIFTLLIEGFDKNSGEITKSKLHFVDLAGSERYRAVKEPDHLVKESKYINLSLTYLE